MMLITKTCELITEESAENGDLADQWFDFEDAEYEFKEIVRDLEGLEPSSYPITVANAANTCFTSYGGRDYVTGEYENYSLHYSKANPTKNLKHWIAAIKAAGHNIKQ